MYVILRTSCTCNPSDGIDTNKAFDEFTCNKRKEIFRKLYLIEIYNNSNSFSSRFLCFTASACKLSSQKFLLHALYTVVVATFIHLLQGWPLFSSCCNYAVLLFVNGCHDMQLNHFYCTVMASNIGIAPTHCVKCNTI